MHVVKIGFVLGVLVISLQGAKIVLSQDPINIVCSTSADLDCVTQYGGTTQQCPLCTLGSPNQCVGAFKTAVVDAAYKEQVALPPKAPGFNTMNNYTPIVCVQKKSCTSCDDVFNIPGLGLCTPLIMDVWEAYVTKATFELTGACIKR